MPLILRSIKGTKLTHLELDGNFAERVSAPAHAFTVGQGVRHDWALSQADSPSNVAAGIVCAVEADHYWVATRDGDIVTWTGHGLGASGTRAWDSQGTPGGFGARPNSGVIRPFLRVIDVNTVMIERGPMEFI